MVTFCFPFDLVTVKLLLFCSVLMFFQQHGVLILFNHFFCCFFRVVFCFSGTSSAEVKENRNVGNLEDRTVGSVSECQSLFRPDTTKGGSSNLKRKRPLEEDNNGHLCQLRLVYKKLSWSEAPKNALVQLNELRPGLQYRVVSQTGPVHAPVFSIAVQVNGLTFEGSGPTKKKAKMRAAELALKSFVQFPNAPQAHLAMGNVSNPSADFTSDQADFPDVLFKEFEASPCSHSLLRRGRLLRHTLDLMVQAQQRLGGIVPEPENPKSAVAVLNELRPGLRYACLSERAEGRRLRSFVMAVRVDGHIFEGCGRSKKLAKNQAAQWALQDLFNIRTAPEGKKGLRPGRKSCPRLPQVSAQHPPLCLSFLAATRLPTGACNDPSSRYAVQSQAYFKK